MANYNDQQFEARYNALIHAEIAIITTEWNASVNNEMLNNALDYFRNYKNVNTQIFTVPGSFEIPQIANHIALQKKHHAIICFGTIIKGETIHDEVLAYSVTEAILNISIQNNLPVILGVLTTHTYQQAIDRANGKKGNKGKDCAHAALAMISLNNNIANI